ncbi:MAG: hypothetical protein GY756_21455 [bacterium]|nr:hypothetical protein [bacterium]
MNKIYCNGCQFLETVTAEGKYYNPVFKELQWCFFHDRRLYRKFNDRNISTLKPDWCTIPKT